MDPGREVDLARERVARVCEAAERRLAEVRARLSALREQQVRQAPAAGRELAEFARSARAPVALRVVQQRIDRAELSWEQVVLGAGVPGGGGDPAVHGVRALLGRGLAPLPAAVRRAFDEAARP